MRYYALDIFVNKQSMKTVAFGSAPAFGMVSNQSWGLSPVRRLTLACEDKKVFVSVYNADISLDFIKKLAASCVAKHE